MANQTRHWEPTKPTGARLDNTLPFKSPGRVAGALYWWLHENGHIKHAEEELEGAWQWALRIELADHVPTGGDRFSDWVIEKTPHRNWTPDDIKGLRKPGFYHGWVKRNKQERIELFYRDTPNYNDPDIIIGVAVRHPRVGKEIPSVPGDVTDARFFSGDQHEAAYDYAQEIEDTPGRFNFLSWRESDWEELGYPNFGQ